MFDSPEWVLVKLPAGIVIHGDRWLLCLLLQLNVNLDTSATSNGIEKAALKE